LSWKLLCRSTSVWMFVWAYIQGLLAGLEQRGLIWMMPWESCLGQAAHLGHRFREPGVTMAAWQQLPGWGLHPNKPGCVCGFHACLHHSMAMGGHEYLWRAAAGRLHLTPMLSCTRSHASPSLTTPRPACACSYAVGLLIRMCLNSIKIWTKFTIAIFNWRLEELNII